MKEREEKKGRLAVDHSVLGAEEPAEPPLDFMDTLPREGPSQEGKSRASQGLGCTRHAAPRSWAEDGPA